LENLKYSFCTKLKGGFTMPYRIEAECPCCGKKKEGLNDVEKFFGFRKMENGEEIPQSYCRACRSAGCKKNEQCKVK
jgi:hypothetical protein